MKVLLVDDEEMIRNGIYEAIDWGKLGMEVIGQAEDGEEALQIFQELEPQLILTDIKMPFMDGLELVEKVKRLSADTYIIIISGYDEFQYAQKAVKLGANDFILKPIDLDYLEQLLVKIKMDDEQKKMKALEENTLKERAVQSLTVLKADFFKELIFRKLTDEQVKEKIQELWTGNIFAYNSVMIIQLDESDKDNQAVYPLFHFVKERMAKEQSQHFVEMNKNELVICLLGENEFVVNNRMKMIMNTIRSFQVQYAAYSFTIALGTVYSSLASLPDSYEEALEALGYKFILGNNQNIFYEKIKEKKENQASIIKNIDQEIIYSIDFTDKENIKVEVTRLFSNIKSAGRDSYLYSQLIVSSIYMSSIQTLNEVGGNMGEIFEDPMKELKQISKSHTIEDALHQLLTSLYKIADYVNKRGGGKIPNLIDKAKRYMTQNFQTPSLSLDDAASHINVSNSYFSIIFKQETGYTFVDYLTLLRMEKAKYLLKASSYRTYEISELVGYNNSTYFSTLFKRQFGCSPSEYRKKV
ncbi:response regulator [Niallia nealsonii]|uniref:Stage 0 sporulation protein A homolog n=1 Tax=Niallia nealsonii TaxID=115979 RepID=A0A2N0Z6Z8_9BACI|nr:response regulator [Niallia nealsonii]PKG25267.1 hypothetical protein CWS01_01980 [Niallia nealsonii]